MSRLTRKRRQEIVDEYLSESGANRYVPEEFIRWLSGRPEHPAYHWFEWDDDKAAHSHRLNQARDFAAGLRVSASFSVQTTQGKPVRVVSTEMPAMISPREGWRDGGGYVPLSPDDPESMESFCDEAARALDAWRRRYEAAVLYRGGKMQPVEKVIALLSVREGKAA